MKLGIMQPYFFPYLEYFRLISACDMWIGFDTVKYNRKSWMNRNRILNREKGWSYVNVPIARSDGPTAIATAAINESEDWRRVFFDKLRVYEFAAPHYVVTLEILTELLREDFATLSDLNMHIIRRLCRWLYIETRIERLSDLNLNLPESSPPGEWALRIAQAVGAESYINSSGGTALFDQDLYRSEGVALRFHEHINFLYDTGPYVFVPDLSIIDALMWVDHEHLRVVVSR
jgi:hypothetical protein